MATGENGLDLGVSDGTASGTRMIDLDSDDAGERYGERVVLGDRLFFVFDDPDIGKELFRTSGTLGDTLPVRDINPDAKPSNPSDLVIYRGHVFFVAESASGRELWRSNGNEKTTVPVVDFAPGAADGVSRVFVTGGDSYEETLYISGDDGSGIGTELYIAEKEQPYVTGMSLLDPHSPVTPGTLRFKVTFNEAVLGVNDTDFQLVQEGTGTSEINNVSAVDEKTLTEYCGFGNGYWQSDSAAPQSYRR